MGYTRRRQEQASSANEEMSRGKHHGWGELPVYLADRLTNARTRRAADRQRDAVFGSRPAARAFRMAGLAFSEFLQRRDEGVGPAFHIAQFADFLAITVQHDNRREALDLVLVGELFILLFH